MTTQQPEHGARSPRRTVVGTVVSDRMQKTIVVREDRLVPHPRYGKYQKRSSVFKAHDEREVADRGDVVEIAFARRLSKTKHWRLVRVVTKGKAEAVRGEEDLERIVSRPARGAASAAPGAASPEVPGSGASASGASEVSS